MTRQTIALALTTTIVVGLHGQQEPTFRQNVEGVRLDVQVARDRAPVTGLRAEDFVVTDNGVEQTVTVTALNDAPLRVCLLVDTSASLEGRRLAELTAGAAGVSAGLREADRVALYTFSLRLNRALDFGEDRRDVARRLRTISSGGFTALRDSVFAALQVIPSDDIRTVILLLTDGIDTASWLTVDDVMNAAGQSEAVIQVVHETRGMQPRMQVAVPTVTPSLVPAENVAARLRMLEELARLTGGRYWSMASLASLQTTFMSALEDMRTRYVLSYSPLSPNKPGWHDVKVRLRSRRADIVVRPRYWVPAD